MRKIKIFPLDKYCDDTMIGDYWYAALENDVNEFINALKLEDYNLHFTSVYIAVYYNH